MSDVGTEWWVSPGNLQLLPECQTRALAEDAIEEYAEAMKRGDSFPAVHAVRFEEVLIVVDGWHRVHAADKAGKKVLVCLKAEGDMRVARMLSYAANKGHGIRRAPGELQAAIKGCRVDEPAWTDVAIAEHVGCSKRYVGVVLRPKKKTKPRKNVNSSHPPSAETGTKETDAPEDDETGDEDTTDQPPADPLDAVLAAAHASAESILEPLRAAVKAAHAVKRAGGPLAASAAMLPKKIATARKAFEQHLPVRCPKCGQDTREDCAHCRGKGWIKTMSDQ